MRDTLDPGIEHPLDRGPTSEDILSRLAALLYSEQRYRGLTRCIHQQWLQFSLWRRLVVSVVEQEWASVFRPKSQYIYSVLVMRVQAWHLVTPSLFFVLPIEATSRSSSHIITRLMRVGDVCFDQRR